MVSSTLKHTTPFKNCFGDTDTNILRMCVHILLNCVFEYEAVFPDFKVWRFLFLLAKNKCFAVHSQMDCQPFIETIMRKMYIFPHYINMSLALIFRIEFTANKYT